MVVCFVRFYSFFAQSIVARFIRARSFSHHDGIWLYVDNEFTFDIYSLMPTNIPNTSHCDKHIAYF